MKSFKLLLSVFALVAFAAAPVLRAEDAPTLTNKKMNAGERVRELTKKLDLTADQVAKLKPILKDEMAAMKALKDDTSLDKDAKREKMMEIRKAHHEQINAILTPEQQAKFKVGREKHKEKSGDHKPHDGE